MELEYLIPIGMWMESGVSLTTVTCPIVHLRAYDDTPMHVTAGTYVIPLARAQWYPYVPSTTHPCM